MFRYLAERGMIEIEDWSNYNMSARFKAGAMGLPFIPTRGPLGGDIASSNRTKIIDCPFTGRPIALLPASNPNVAIIHVNAADKYGNCIIRGTDATCAEIAMASAHTIVTCEQLVDHEQIVHDESKSAANGIFSSYLQVRGSIPTFWTQESSVTMPKPPIELNRVDPTYTATQLHFQDLFTRYGSPICVWDLVKQSEKREREGVCIAS